MTTKSQDNDALAIRDTAEHEFPILQLRDKKQIIATVVSTLDKSIDVALLGVMFNDPLMANPIVDIAPATIAIGSGTTQTIEMQTDAQWDYIRVVATATDIPTAGTLKVVIKAPRGRRV